MKMWREAEKFVAAVEGGEAVLEFALKGGEMEMTHVFVPEAARGQAVAAELAKAAFEHARESGLHVIPTCPYIKSFVKKNPEYKELVK